MSSTRHAKDDSVFHQSRYASSPEFERGLIANLVAKRCAILDDKADCELVWFVQYLSHQDGGLAAVATELLKKYLHRLGTAAMLKSESQKNFSAAEVAAIRQEIPRELRRRFPLRGETKSAISAISDSKQYLRIRGQAENSRRIRDKAAVALDRYEMIVTGREDELDIQEREEAKKNPASYPVATFRDLCRQAAERGPAYDLNEAAPWYFSDLPNVLREHHQQWVKDKSKIVVTALGKKVCAALDYTLHSRSLSLLEGNPRLGKSFSARAWCLQHPGKARFIEIPATNDDASFFRALARGLGLGNFLKYKVAEIRERVESVLLAGDLLLVLDEAQRLWPQRNLRYGFPSRILWVMTLANAGVPVCLVSTPQFIQTQKVLEKTGWNSAQLTGRIGHYEFLPTKLDDSDLMAVGRSVLPEASEEVLKALAIYARTSDRYLAAVDSIAKRAKYIAQLDARPNCTTADIRTAMKESVIPSDTLLVRALDQAKSAASPRRELPSEVSPTIEQIKIPPTRTIKPTAEIGADIPRRAGGVLEVMKG